MYTHAVSQDTLRKHAAEKVFWNTIEPIIRHGDWTINADCWRREYTPVRTNSYGDIFKGIIYITFKPDSTEIDSMFE